MPKGVYERKPASQCFFENFIPEPNTGCWLWTGAVRRGYGHHWDGKSVAAHRYAYELHFGEIPSGKFVCHKCDNKSCVNPDHLFLDDHAGNMRDMVKKGRQAKGIRNSHAKLTEPKVRAIKALLKHGWSRKYLAQEYKVTPAAIGAITRGKNWGWV